MAQLNFARKWRSQTFNELVGQELSVRILKNTLYLNQFFPVYLFSGQRGCGKTSTARIFAKAINCERLTDFRSNPRAHDIPCLACTSCLAMHNAQHPDFIEMDAASHTGVDNVRNIIDAASLLPVMGSKKIYLIDEAHMLSKAAFNAFLKILEEPPRHVIFILATTEVHKIIDTVRSRSFQLFFKAVEPDVLVQHLVAICQKESIAAEEDALAVIARETHGSVRDALNMLEQVRFSTARVTKEAVLRVLGHCDDATIIDLVRMLVEHNDQDLMLLLQSLAPHEAMINYVWRALLDAVYDLILLFYQLPPRSFTAYQETLQEIVGTSSLKVLIRILSELQSHEQLMARSRNPRILLQTILLKIAQADYTEQEKSAPVIGEKKKELRSQPAAVVTDQPMLAKTEFHEFWQGCLEGLAALDDPILHSVFKQAQCQFFSPQTGEIMLSFASKLAFFEETVMKAEGQWKPLLDAYTGKSVQLTMHFQGLDKPTQEKAQPVKIEKPVTRPAAVQASKPAYGAYKKSTSPSPIKQGARIDVSRAAEWPKAQELLAIFPGVVTEVVES